MNVACSECGAAVALLASDLNEDGTAPASRICANCDWPAEAQPVAEGDGSAYWTKPEPGSWAEWFRQAQATGYDLRRLSSESGYADDRCTTGATGAQARSFVRRTANGWPVTDRDHAAYHQIEGVTAPCTRHGCTTGAKGFRS